MSQHNVIVTTGAWWLADNGWQTTAGPVCVCELPQNQNAGVLKEHPVLEKVYQSHLRRWSAS